MQAVLAVNDERTAALHDGQQIGPELAGPWRQAAGRLEGLWQRYTSMVFSRQKYSPPWQAAEHTALIQLAHDPLLDWAQRARRLAELVPGAPLRDGGSLRRRWGQLVAKARANGGWEVAWSPEYRCHL